MVLQQIKIQDPLDLASTVAIEVEVVLSDGQRRWCFFMTPEALAACGDMLGGTQVRLHYGAPHMIVMTTLTEGLIEQALRYIDAQGDLIACTRPVAQPAPAAAPPEPL
jgi:hypothetical protein